MASSPSMPAAKSVSETDPSLNAAPTKCLSPWDTAVGIATKSLHEYGLSPLCNASGQSACEILDLAMKDLQTASEGTDRRSDKAAGILRLQEILRGCDNYAQIVDTAVPYSAHIAALVWSDIRVTLQLALNYADTMESLEAATAIIAEKMALCNLFASVYEEIQHSGAVLSPPSAMSRLQQALHLSLPKFYAAIVVFTVKVRHYFDPSTPRMAKIKYWLKPFVIELQAFIDGILEQEKRVCECIDVATMGTLKESSQKLAQIGSHLTDLQSKLIPLTRLDDITNIIARNFEPAFEGQRKISRISLDESMQYMLASLTSLGSLKRHQYVQSRRLDGTGTWLLRDERFLLWRDSYTREGVDCILCCYGDSGVGKTVMSSIVIDDLASQFPERDDVGIAFIYCDHRDQGSQTLIDILGSLLRQLLCETSTLLEKVWRILYRRCCRLPDTKTMVEMIKLTLMDFRRSFICIDAFDELDPTTRFDLLNILRNEFTAPYTRVFLSGRPSVQEAVNGCLGTQQQDAIHIVANRDDIVAYLSHEIVRDCDVNPGGMNDMLKDEILGTITEKSNGMFLLAALHIRIVIENQTILERRHALDTLPETIGHAFAEVVDIIIKSPTYRDLGKPTLILLHLAYRPLKLDELRHALAVEAGHIEQDKDNIPSRKKFLDSCLGWSLLLRRHSLFVLPTIP